MSCWQLQSIVLLSWSNVKPVVAVYGFVVKVLVEKSVPFHGSPFYPDRMFLTKGLFHSNPSLIPVPGFRDPFWVNGTDQCKMANAIFPVLIFHLPKLWTNLFAHECIWRAPKVTKEKESKATTFGFNNMNFTERRALCSVIMRNVNFEGTFEALKFLLQSGIGRFDLFFHYRTNKKFKLPRIIPYTSRNF